MFNLIFRTKSLEKPTFIANLTSLRSAIIALGANTLSRHTTVVFLEAATAPLANSDPKMAACREIRKGSKWPYGGR